MHVKLNTQQLINSLTGKNKQYIEENAREQEIKYGNVDVFEAEVFDSTFGVYTNPETGEQEYPITVNISFGENWIEFYFDRNGNIKDTSGNGQGSRHQPYLENVAKELWRNVKEDL